MLIAKTFGLFAVTAMAEILGCYLPFLWLKKGASAWLLAPGAAALLLFVWLLAQHPVPSGRVYAAYGGMYVVVAIGWLWIVDGVTPSRWDVLGIAMVMAGMATIVRGGWRA